MITKIINAIQVFKKTRSEEKSLSGAREVLKASLTLVNFFPASSTYLGPAASWSVSQ